MRRRIGTDTACGLLLAATLASGAGAADHPPVQTDQRPAVVVQVHDNGFHWGDAAIGAAATLGITLAAGGVLVLARPRPPRPERNHDA